MRIHHAACWSRREFFAGITLAGTAGPLGRRPGLMAAEPPPETTRIRLVQTPSMCQAPQYVAEELLQGEGFTEVVYLKKEGPYDIADALASGEVDSTCTSRPASSCNWTGLSPSPSWQVPTQGVTSCSRRAKLRPSWGSRRGRRSCAPARLATSSSTATSIGPGLSTSAAWWRRTGRSSSSTRWPRSAPCAPS